LHPFERPHSFLPSSCVILLVFLLVLVVVLVASPETRWITDDVL
jgi:hypothetical protein